MPEHLELLRTAIPYIRVFKKRVFVIKLGGQLCKPGKNLSHVVDQIALLYQLGIRIVVVHGGGEQADALAERLGVSIRKVGGRRVTDDKMLEVVKMAFGAVNTDLVAAFRGGQVPIIGLSGIDGDLITAERRPPQQIVNSSGKDETVDFGHVGDITDIDTEVLTTILDGGYVPLICPLAVDKRGRMLNINADTIAAKLAVALDATKYFLVTSVDGIMKDLNDPRTLQSYIDLEDLTGLIESGVISGGMLPKVAACRIALHGGVRRVHIINGLKRDTLLAEVFTNEGSGTLIVAEKDNEPEEPALDDDDGDDE